jgi:glycosyltransferase involved in cell wall biosynthesis
MADVDNTSTEPINALLVIDDDVLLRLGSVVRHLCVGMMDESVRITVLARTSKILPEDAVGPARLVTIPARRWPLRKVSSDQLLSLLDGTKPDVIHCLSADLAQWVRRWAQAWQSALVVHLTDLADVYSFSSLGYDGPMTAIATTPSVERAAVRKAGRKADVIRVVPLGIPVAQAEPVCLADPSRIPTAIVTVPLTRNCGLHLVLKALSVVIRDGREMQLFVLASGPGEFLFRRIVNQLDLRQRVTFAGQTTDLPTLQQVMQGADFYILPSERRRFTVSTLTAMATGLAILAPTGTIGDYLIEGQTASLFDSQIPSQLARKWTALLDDPNQARTLARQALQHIRDHHQASIMVSRTADAYRDLCRSDSVAS